MEEPVPETTKNDVAPADVGGGNPVQKDDKGNKRKTPKNKRQRA